MANTKQTAVKTQGRFDAQVKYFKARKAAEAALLVAPYDRVAYLKTRGAADADLCAARAKDEYDLAKKRFGADVIDFGVAHAKANFNAAKAAFESSTR